MGYIPNRREGTIVIFPWPYDCPVYDVHVHYSRHEGEIAEAFVDLFKHGSVKALKVSGPVSRRLPGLNAS
jgi:hypothetical protein